MSSTLVLAAEDPAALAWLVFLQVERRLPPISPEHEE